MSPLRHGLCFIFSCVALLGSAAGEPAPRAADGGGAEDEVASWLQARQRGGTGGRADDEEAAAARPHILYLLADDFGWANIGLHRRGWCHGDLACLQGQAEVHTPALDALADEGVLLERHYTYRICSPSRTSLQSGRLGVHVNMVNAAVTMLNRRDPISGYQGMPRNMTGLGQKMRDLGYRTHLVGKWDVGTATPQHTPQGRGYETWMGYFLFANNYWTKNNTLTSTGVYDNCLNTFTDYFLINQTYVGGVRNKELLTDSCQDSDAPDPPCYEEHAFKQKALEIIHHHNASDREHPLFLFYASHLVHTPLDVPKSYLAEIDRLVKRSGGKPFGSANRRKYAAMVLYLDRTAGELVSALKLKGMYDSTLIVFHSDNGGPIYEPGAANNYPHRGGKFSDFEGGVRTNAFLSGGFLPKRLRGTRHHGVVSIADWYGTLCVLGGGAERECLSDPEAEEANKWIAEHNAIHPHDQLPLLHKVDSVVQWPYILSGENGRPGPLHLTNSSLLEWPYKLIVGKQPFGGWQGPLYPNCSTITGLRDGQGPLMTDLNIFGASVLIADSPEENAQMTQQYDCKAGCLFNVEADPSERHDLASCPRHAKVLARMQKTLELLNKDNFEPDRGSVALEACLAQIDNGGYYGPFVDTEGWYSPVDPVDDPEKKAEIVFANTEFGTSFVISGVERVVPAIRKAAESEDKCLYPCFGGD